MPFLGGLLSFLQALPKLLDLISRIGAYIKERDLLTWLSDLDESIQATKKANTPEAKHEAARRLVDIIGRIN